jgi:hypothetical protein
MDVS